MNPLFSIFVVNRESYRSPNYIWKNANRDPEDLWVIQRTLKGRAFHVNTSGIRSFIYPGQAMLFRHDDGSIYGYAEGDKEVYEMEFISMRGDIADAICGQLIKEYGAIINLDPAGEASAQFAVIMKMFKERSFRDAVEASEHVYRLLLAAYREQGNLRMDNDPVAYCHSQIENLNFRPISIKSLAGELGISREHLTRLYKARFGRSPGSRLRQLRISRAQTILASTTLSIEEVSLACGFSSANSFYRAFRRMTGHSPLAYRRRFSRHMS